MIHPFFFSDTIVPEHVFPDLLAIVAGISCVISSALTLVVRVSVFSENTGDDAIHLM